MDKNMKQSEKWRYFKEHIERLKSSPEPFYDAQELAEFEAILEQLEQPKQWQPTRREIIATAVIQGLSANRWSMELGNYSFKNLADMAVEQADELIKKLDEDEINSKAH